MTTIELLEQRARGLASRLDGAGEPELRRVAAAIAQAAAERAGLTHPVIVQALAHLSASPKSPSQLRAQVQTLAEQLDADYLNLKQPYEERDDAGKTEPTVTVAFSKARAASAVAAAFDSDARIAAATAAYEAIVGTDDPVYLEEIADRVLKR